jgi:endonuclease/exonuclease/phosphatase family metal-dependent hydrolase
MRLATYNVAWFDSLFDARDRLRLDGTRARRHGVSRAEQGEALATVFRALDADAVLIVEAPDSSSKRSTVAALEAFAAAFDLRTRSAVMGFANQTKQEIALLFDRDALTVEHAPRPGDYRVPRFDGVFEIDLDIDDRKDAVRFSKPPLELDVETARGMRFHLIGAHLKSKAPHNAKSDADVMRVAIANRRKQLAQAIWLRARIDQHLGEATPLIVMGDLNDGPGLDAFEGLFGRSSLEIVLGADSDAPLREPHAEQALHARLGAAPTTARFWIEQEEKYLQALLDYVMLSDEFMAAHPRWRIWHPLDDPECWAASHLREALVTASDHFPVSVDLDI